MKNMLTITSCQRTTSRATRWSTGLIKVIISAAGVFGLVLSSPGLFIVLPLLIRAGWV